MILNEQNFIIYAAKHYDQKRASSVEEFYDDIKRLQYLKRLFKRYDEDDELKVRLILNHLIVLYNCFGPAATNMVFMKLEEYSNLVKPFVMLLGYMPEQIQYNDKVIKSYEIPMDQKIVDELRKI
jgi:hypothetical protein